MSDFSDTTVPEIPGGVTKMTLPDELTELHRHLDDLGGRIGEAARQLDKRQKISAADRQKIDEMRNRAETIKQRLQGVQPSSWTAMKQEIESEWNVLTHSFEEWARHIDSDYGRGS